MKKKFGIDTLKRIYLFVKYKIFKYEKHQNSFYLNGKRIKMKQAPEPSDIYWENLATTTKQTVEKTIITFMITIICLIISFIVSLMFGIFKDNLENKTNNSTNNEAAFQYFLILLITFGNSIFISFINTVLARIIRSLTLLERHETHTQYDLSVSLKLTFAMFINTGLIPLFVNYNETSWFTKTGLSMDILFNLLALCFLSPLFYILTPEYMIKVCMRRREQKKGSESKMTQRQLNELFEGQKFDMAQRYAVTCNIIMIC